MKTSQDILLQLLRVSLGNSGELDYDSSKGNWEDVINLATEHGVLGVAFDAFEKLPDTCRPDIDSLMKWLGQTSYQETQYDQNWNVACELAEFWKESNIQATILKGRAIAQYYPKPNHRYSCDLDVLIPIQSDWNKACELLETKGIKLEYEVYKEVEFTYKDVYVECHRYITPVRGNENLLKFERYLRSLLKSKHPICFEGTSLVNPPLMFSIMLYIEHALWDLLHGKLLLKHVADWMVLRSTLRDALRQTQEQELELKEESIELMCKEFGFDRFLKLINAMADVVEGKQELTALPATYQQVFESMFQQQTENKDGKSWFQRRIGLFFEIIRNRKMYLHFGYCSMEHFLFNSMWTHFFRKDVEI